MRRKPGAWSQRLVVVAVLAAVVVILVDGSRSLNHTPRPTRSPTPTDTTGVVNPQVCAPDGMTLAIRIRPPSHRQLASSDWATVNSRHPVATVVLQNVSHHPCYGGSGHFDLTIQDRVGTTVAQWDNSHWFDATYQPGEYRTFSLPAVYSCTRPGPFTALATVGAYTARRNRLRRGDITCS
jgi:hypothetical protein